MSIPTITMVETDGRSRLTLPGRKGTGYLLNGEGLESNASPFRR